MELGPQVGAILAEGRQSEGDHQRGKTIEVPVVRLAGPIGVLVGPVPRLDRRQVGQVGQPHAVEVDKLDGVAHVPLGHEEDVMVLKVAMGGAGGA